MVSAELGQLGAVVVSRHHRRSEDGLDYVTILGGIDSSASYKLFSNAVIGQNTGLCAKQVRLVKT